MNEGHSAFFFTVRVCNTGGWRQEQIAGIAGMTQGRASQIINNTNFGKINNLLAQGRNMDYIASDIATRDNRPEIQYHHWDSRDGGWPIAKNPDLIFILHTMPAAVGGDV